MKKILFVFMLFASASYGQGDDPPVMSYAKCQGDSCFLIYLSADAALNDSGSAIKGAFRIMNYTDKPITLAEKLNTDYMAQLADFTRPQKQTDLVFQIQRLKEGYRDFYYSLADPDDAAAKSYNSFGLEPKYATLVPVVLIPKNNMANGKYRVRALFNAAKYGECSNTWTNWVYFDIVRKKD